MYKEQSLRIYKTFTRLSEWLTSEISWVGVVEFKRTV